MKYPLLGVEDALLLVARFPDWAHVYKGHESGAELVEAVQGLGREVDTTIARSYARGRPPSAWERRRLDRHAAGVRAAFGERFGVAASLSRRLMSPFQPPDGEGRWTRAVRCAVRPPSTWSSRGLCKTGSSGMSVGRIGAPTTNKPVQGRRIEKPPGRETARALPVSLAENHAMSQVGFLTGGEAGLAAGLHPRECPKRAKKAFKRPEAAR